VWQGSTCEKILLYAGSLRSRRKRQGSHEFHRYEGQNVILHVDAEEGEGELPKAARGRRLAQYNFCMERKIFWAVFIVLGLLADFILPLWWALGATIPILFIAWWVAYRSDWF